MRRSWNLISMIAAVAIALFLPAFASAAVSVDHIYSDQPYSAVCPAAPPAVHAADYDGYALIQPSSSERSLGSPGAAYAIGAGSSNIKVTNSQKETPFGGAVGLAEFGIRGPTTV